MRLAPLSILSLLVIVSCKKDEEKLQGGSLCIAPNPADVFTMPEEFKDSGYPPGTKFELRAQGNKYTVPNQQILLPDAKATDDLELWVNDARKEVFKIGHGVDMHGPKLCYYFRKFKDLTLTGGWILDQDRPSDRCTCFDGEGK